MNIEELKAFSQGQADHTQGKKLEDNPHRRGSKPYKAWIKGWNSYE